MPCQLKNLVQNDLVQIQHCSCGLVHLHFGPVSIRVPEGDLAQVAQALGKARDLLEPDVPNPVNVRRFRQKLSFRLE